MYAIRYAIITEKRTPPMGIEIIGEPVLEEFKRLVSDLVQINRYPGLKFGSPVSGNVSYKSPEEVKVNTGLHLKGYDIKNYIAQLGTDLKMGFPHHNDYGAAWGIKQLKTENGSTIRFPVTVWDMAHEIMNRDFQQE
jgi:hypothetical protein